MPILSSAKAVEYEQRIPELKKAFGDSYIHNYFGMEIYMYKERERDVPHIHLEVDSAVSSRIQRNAALALSMVSVWLSMGKPRAALSPGSFSPCIHHNPLDR